MAFRVTGIFQMTFKIHRKHLSKHRIKRGKKYHAIFSFYWPLKITTAVGVFP